MMRTVSKVSGTTAHSGLHWEGPDLDGDIFIELEDEYGDMIWLSRADLLAMLKATEETTA